MPENGSRPRDGTDLPLAPLETTGMQGKALDVLALQWPGRSLRCWLTPSGALHVSVDGEGGRQLARYAIDPAGGIARR